MKRKLLADIKDGINSTKPKTLGDIVSENIKKAPRQYKTGFFLSQISLLSKYCIRQEIYMQTLFALGIRDFIDTAPPPSLQKIFDVGTAAHSWWQNKYLGPARVLYGSWRCTRCRGTYTGFMSNSPCNYCGWSMALEVKPGQAQPVIKCFEACKWPGGYNTENRDCVKCRFSQGEYEYVEPRVRFDLFPNSHITLPEGFLKDFSVEIRGYCDGIIDVGGVRKVLEIKTINTFSYNKLTKAHANHELQCLLAMWGLGLDYGIIVYLNKETGGTKEFEVELDLNKIGRVLKQVSIAGVGIELYTRALLDAQNKQDYLSDTDLNELLDTSIKVLNLPKDARVCISPEAELAKNCGVCNLCFLNHVAPIKKLSNNDQISWES